MSAWVDYKTLRETTNFATVLDYYRVDYKRKGTQATALCPLPTHKEAKNSPSFSVSFEKRIWQCFGCGLGGNVLDFVTRMEGLDPRNVNEFRRAAILVQERFGGGATHKQPTNTPPPPKRQSQPPQASAQPKRTLSSVVINEPLDFELKNLDTKPQYLLSRGFNERTIDHFGLGYCSKGMLAGRIAIPLHNMQGRLIGYAGRLIYDDAIDEDNPKYLFPGKRERNGRTLEFAKSLFVYNGHRIQTRETDLIIVQGFTSAWWLWQNGHQNVVAVMGNSCRVDQAKIIVNLVSPTGRVWFLTDGTKDGERCAEGLFFDIGPHRFCKWIKLREGQPTNYGMRELAAMLEWKIIP